MEISKSVVNSNLDQDKKNIDDNKTIEQENHNNKNYSIWEIEEFLKNNQLPPGIKTYEDMPPGIPLKASENVIPKIKKPWETKENILQFNDIFMDSDGNNKPLTDEINNYEK